MDDLISKQAAIYIVHKVILEFFYSDEDNNENPMTEKDKMLLEINKKISNGIKDLLSAQSETSRIENALHGKSAEEQFDFLAWLLQDYGMRSTNTRVAVIEWLKGNA